MPKAPEAVIMEGVESEVATATVPVKLAELEMVCPFIKPEVMAPEPRFNEEPVAAPMLGVVNEGEVESTTEPEPVEVVVPVPPRTTVSVPVTLVPARLTALAVICWPVSDK